MSGCRHALFLILPGVELCPLAYRVTVTSFQFAKDDRGKECHSAKNKERPVDSVNELWSTGSMAIGNEESSHQGRRSDAKTDGHLLDRSRDARAAVNGSREERHGE
jgi:hypothetical protein